MPDQRAAKPEVIYAVRRADGDLLGEYLFCTVDAGDWTPAEDDSESADDPIEYEMVRMTVEVIATRTLPQCRECDEPARHWGLCEPHARLDDPDYFEVTHG